MEEISFCMLDNQFLLTNHNCILITKLRFHSIVKSELRIKINDRNDNNMFPEYNLFLKEEEKGEKECDYLILGIIAILTSTKIQ